MVTVTSLLMFVVNVLSANLLRASRATRVSCTDSKSKTIAILEKLGVFGLEGD